MNTLREIKIAIVEDDDFTRQRISSILKLRMPQANIVEFEDLKTAQKFAATDAQDFWLIDLGLPDGSGIELIRAVKKYTSMLMCWFFLCLAMLTI